MELLKLLILSFVVSFAFLIVVDRVTGNLVDKYYDSIDYEERETNRYARQFQKKIKKNDLKSTDKKKLDKWVLKKRVLLIAIYKKNRIVYNCSGVSASALEDQDDWSAKPYKLKFADGKASVYIQGVLFLRIVLLCRNLFDYFDVRRLFQHRHDRNQAPDEIYSSA